MKSLLIDHPETSILICLITQQSKDPIAPVVLMMNWLRLLEVVGVVVQLEQHQLVAVVGVVGVAEAKGLHQWGKSVSSALGKCLRN